MGKVKRNQKRMILHLWPNEYWIIITAEGPEERVAHGTPKEL